MGAVKFEAETGFLAQVEIEAFEYVDVVLTSGHVVTVFDDKVFVRAPGQPSQVDGALVWARGRVDTRPPL